MSSREMGQDQMPSPAIRQLAVQTMADRLATTMMRCTSRIPPAPKSTVFQNPNASSTATPRAVRYQQ